jgi:hypothetical protein
MFLNPGDNAMDDTRSYIVARYTGLDEGSQILVLAKIANHLTLVGRETYDLHSGVEDSVRLRSVNEAIGRILEQQLHLLSKDEDRYPDDVFANILADQFSALELDESTILKFIQWLEGRKPLLKG